ncbi:MAG: cohesin domain-containing protein [Bacillota bacterium]|nr:cohesin domain-containing protein [Bacillota bacterium]
MKKNKTLALVLMMLMLVSSMFTNVTFAASSVNVVIGNAQGAKGASVTVPVSIQGLTSGINNCDFRLAYDANAMELEEAVPGSIVPNAVTNFFAYSARPGIISFLFSDSTQGSFQISSNGVFTNLKFKIKDSAEPGSYGVKLDHIGSFSDKNLTKIDANFTSGSLTLKQDEEVATPTPVSGDKLNVSIESVKAVVGQSVTVPINFRNMPRTGINNCDFRLQFNSDVFDIENVAPGPIIVNPTMDFYSYVKSNGLVSFLFCDSTIGSNQINKDGLFASVKLKVKSYAKPGEYKIAFSKIGSFSDKDINAVPVSANEGTLAISSDDQTSTVTPTATPTPTTSEQENKASIEIGSAFGASGDEVTIPVKLTTVPKNGINNCDFKLSYDSNALQVVGVEPGNIIPSSISDFVANYSKTGIISFLFSDSTQGSNPISGSGVLANIKVKIKSGANQGEYPVKLSSIGSFSSKNMVPVTATFADGKVTIEAIPSPSEPAVETVTPAPTPTSKPVTENMDIIIGNVNGEAGDVVTLPIKFANVPAQGINNCDFKLSYDSSALEVTGASAGSIIPNALANFISNTNTAGLISFLYSDSTQGAYPIVKDGEFSNITVKIKENAPAGEYQIKCCNVGSISSKNMVKVNADLSAGGVTVTKAQNTPTATPTYTPTAVPSALKVKVDVGNVTGMGQEVTVPINFSNVPEQGINNCDFKLSYDSNALSVIGVEAGDIVTIPAANFVANNDNNGTISFLFNDASQGQNLIIKSGVFANIKFKILNPSLVGNYPITINNVGAFSSKNMVRIDPQFNGGKVTVIPVKNTETPTSTPTLEPTATPTATPTPVITAQKVVVDIGSAKGNAGETVDVPISFKGVPASGINNCDFRLLYDKDALEVLSVTPGSIVQLPAANFFSNKDIPGYISFLYNDVTQGSMQINSDGQFAVIKVKIKDTAASGDYNISLSRVGSISDSKICPILPAFNTGVITVSSAATPLPTPTPVASGFSVVIGDFSGSAGDTVTVPVSFLGFNGEHLNNCDFRLSYDTKAMEVLSVDPGLITTLPVANFSSYTGTQGTISFLFNDATQGSLPIKENGIFANITLKLKTNITSDSNGIKIDKIGSFSDSSFNPINANVVIE